MRPLRRGDELREFFELFQRAVSVMRERESRHAAISEEVVRRMRNALDRAPDLQPAISALEGLVREERQAVGSDPTRPADPARRG
jgi:tRNA C32,U32 (ribose-2'-O)-methylase TrmJ